MLHYILEISEPMSTQRTLNPDAKVGGSIVLQFSESPSMQEMLTLASVSPRH